MKANPLSLVARLASSIENLPARAILFLFVLVIWVLAGQSAWAQIVGTASLNVERRGHTSTQLFDGKVLVVGGENLSGSVSQAEIFDQASQAFSVVGNHRPRTDHTATRLADGRVLVAGGRDSYGFLDDVEIFNPTTNSFSPAPSMKRARGGHSATVLADGKILLVGGDVEGSAEMYDPDTQSFSLLSGRLSAPRSLHAAILLQDGRVLVAGGVDFGNAVLSSAELFYPFMEMFFLTINTMQTTRGLPLLRVLPDGKVQVIGGDAAFSMEMFDPSTDTFIALAYLPPTADLLSATLSTHSRSALISPDVSQHPLLQGTLSNEISDFLNRADHSITELTQSNRALVAGGVNGEGQVLSSAVLVKSSAATITTDKTDYAPGEVVTITGRGWKPNETISIVVHEDPEAYSDTVISAAVDSNGNFVNTQFSPAPIDFGRVFTLTAFGLSSGFAAQTAFRDALSINSVTLTAGSTTVPPGALTVAPGASITATLSVTTSTGGGSNNWRSTEWRVAATPPGSTTCANHPNHDPVGTFTDSFSITAPATAGTYNAYFLARSNDSCGGTASPTFTLAGVVIVKRSTSTSVSLSPGTVVVGQSSTATVTVSDTSSGTKSFPTGTVALSSSVPSDLFAGTCVLAATATPGVSTCSVTVTPSAASVHSISADFAATSVHLASNGSANLTVTKASPSFSNLSGPAITYGDSPTTLSGTIKAGSLVPSGSVAITLNGVTQLAAIDSATGNFFSSFATGSLGVAGAPYIITYSYAGDANFNGVGPDTSKSLTINKRNASVTPNAASKIYGDADPVLTGTLSGFLPADGVTATYARTAGENVGTYTISGTLSPAGVLGNYDITYNTAVFTINKRSASVTPNAASKIYGDADPTLTGTLSGFLAADGVTATYNRTMGETVGSYTINATLSPAGVLGNYDITYNTAAFTINKRPASVTPNAASKTYGDADPALTGTLSGFLAPDSVTATYSRTAGETVGTYTISATLSPAGVLGNYDITYNTASFTINKRAVTVTADAKVKIYGDVDPALTYQITSGSLVGSDTFSGALNRDAGENVGNYAIKQGTLALNGNYDLTYSGASLTINKRPASVTPNAASKTYGDADPVLTGTLSGFLAADSVTAAYSRTAGENVGTYTISATLSPAAALGNYDITYNTATFTIMKRLITVTADAKVKIYGDTDPTFTYMITSGSLVGSDTFSGALARVPGENVGSYAINQGTLALSSNYDLTFVGATLTINKRPASVTPDDANKIYGDADPVLTGTLGGFLAADSVTAAYSRTAGENVGTYTISATLSPAAALGNYDITYNTATLTISKRPITVTADAKVKVYGDADPALTYQITSGSLVGSDTFSGALSRDAGENVGAYAINQETLALSSNYDLTYIGASLTINKRSASVTPNTASKTYGDADPILTGTLSGFLAADGVTATYNRTAGENVGTYTISATLSPAGVLGNYDITYSTALFTINKRAASVTPNAANKTYGDIDPVLTGTLSGFLAADGVTATYSRTAGENVGTYTISATLSPAGVLGNYDITYNSATFTITKRAITVTADAKTKTYGNADPTFTYQITSGSLVGSDTFSGALTRDPGENVGNHAINRGTLALSSNYDLSFIGASLTIIKRPASVTPTAASKTYGEADPALTGTLSGFLPADGVTATYIRAAGENVGIYTINATLSPAGALGNYDIAYNTALFTINKAVLTVSANNQTITLGAPDPIFTFQYNGFKGSDNAGVIDLPPSCGVMVPHTNVGPYSIVCAGGADNNYTFSYVNGTLAVIYNFNGFFRPIDNLPTVNVVNAGSAVPVKFSLNGYQGLNIFDNGYPASGVMACSSSDPVDVVDETVTAGGSSLQYDAGADQYVYVWKTEKSWANSCRQLVVKLKDGTYHRANFKFKK